LKHIILIEDDPGIQDAVAIVLRTAGYQVDVYANGAKILSDELAVPDLFILDNQLSGVNGLDICRLIKTRLSTKDIPVIMLSASPSISVMSGPAGADAYLEKPFAINALRELIKNKLG
jgi:DNA-binding response OmpR family regulator